jgi:hypothetical protein
MIVHCVRSVGWITPRDKAACAASTTGVSDGAAAEAAPAAQVTESSAMFVARSAGLPEGDGMLPGSQPEPGFATPW